VRGEVVTTTTTTTYFLVLGALQGVQGGGGDGSAGGRVHLVLQRHHQDLHGHLHEPLPLVREEQVVVGDAVAHGVVGTHHVEQGGEQGQGVSERGRGRGREGERERGRERQSVLSGMGAGRFTLKRTFGFPPGCRAEMLLGRFKETC